MSDQLPRLWSNTHNRGHQVEWSQAPAQDHGQESKHWKPAREREGSDKYYLLITTVHGLNHQLDKYGFLGRRVQAWFKFKVNMYLDSNSVQNYQVNLYIKSFKAEYQSLLSFTLAFHFKTLPLLNLPVLLHVFSSSSHFILFRPLLSPFRTLTLAFIKHFPSISQHFFPLSQHSSPPSRHAPS